MALESGEKPWELDGDEVDDEVGEDEWSFDESSRHWVNVATGERVTEADWNDPDQWEGPAEDDEDEDEEGE